MALKSTIAMLYHGSNLEKVCQLCYGLASAVDRFDEECSVCFDIHTVSFYYPKSPDGGTLEYILKIIVKLFRK